jgi:outer membrane lipoprotein-sorting protein
LDYIFFSFLNDFDPTELSVDETAYRLELIYNKKMNTMIDKLFLVIDKKTLLIRKIQMQSGYSLQTWDIKDLKLNPKLGNNTFEFKIPEGTEVVDLR